MPENMTLEYELLLHPRVARSCKELYQNGHFKQVVQEAMNQVDKALQEKTGGPKQRKYGVNLFRSVLGPGSKGIKLRVPFGEQMQTEAERLFISVFQYYRNYSVHDGALIDRTGCLRAMILASELLFLVDASLKNLDDVGGTKGLVDAGIFDSEKQLLMGLHEWAAPEDSFVDLFVSSFYDEGYTEEQVEALIDLGLVENHSGPRVPNKGEIKSGEILSDRIEWFSLTEYGKKVCSGIRDHLHKG
jgi:uncharacterized protein (TIGR02391 family)